MLEHRIEKLLKLGFENRLLIIDFNNFAEHFDYYSLLNDYKYEIHNYGNVEEFRVLYEEELKASGGLIAIIANRDIYIPYDIKCTFQTVNLSLSTLLPKLNSDVVNKYAYDLDLISYAYDNCYADCSSHEQTESFLNNTVFTHSMVKRYCNDKSHELCNEHLLAENYTDWFEVAKHKACIMYYAVKFDITVDLPPVDEQFLRFIYNGYSSLSSQVNRNYPTIITKTLDLTCFDTKEKTALIVMDGMSLFDFEVLSRHFTGISFKYYCSYAVIPTTTANSRQSLLSGKYPRELEKPFSLANEEKEFAAAAKRLGYADNQIQYARGYNPEISQHTRIVAIIINEIDDIIHGQRQGRIGMYNDINVLGKSGKLQNLIIKLMRQGFNTYITSDHGNTPCVGVGGFRSGVEVESRSKRMTVLKDFAEINDLLEQNAREYPGFYLNQSYRYYICNSGVSFNNKGESVMTHGGINLDEVIVPFIKITEVKKHG